MAPLVGGLLKGVQPLGDCAGLEVSRGLSRGFPDDGRERVGAEEGLTCVAPRVAWPGCAGALKGPCFSNVSNLMSDGYSCVGRHGGRPLRWRSYRCPAEPFTGHARSGQVIRSSSQQLNCLGRRKPGCASNTAPTDETTWNFPASTCTGGAGAGHGSFTKTGRCSARARLSCARSSANGT